MKITIHRPQDAGKITTIAEFNKLRNGTIVEDCVGGLAIVILAQDEDGNDKASLLHVLWDDNLLTYYPDSPEAYFPLRVLSGHKIIIE